MNYLRKNADIFIYLFILTCFFIFIEFSYFLTVNRSYIAEFKLISNQFNIPINALFDLSLFAFIQLMLHMVLCGLIGLIVLSLTHCFRIRASNIFYLAIVVWILTLLTILFANAYYFPNSSFAELIFVSTASISIIFKCLLFLTSSIFFIALLHFALHFYKQLIILLMIGFALKLTFDDNNYKNNNYNQYQTHSNTANLNYYHNKPNIIIVGIDSLRPDFLSFFSHPDSTVFIDSFLQNATVFSDAVTPLARTFPSWVSILTGQYPSQHGMRTNLAQSKDINFSVSLPNILKQYGYHTIYATDEARFSNIDQKFGFNQMVTPPMGINDFIIGTLNDFPLSNLIINTKLGSILFPYNYSNRASYVNYDPDSFLSRLQQVLHTNTQPLFLAVHFCLPHYPYSWKDLPEKHLSMRARYQASIRQMDKQLANFFAILQDKNLLDNTLVVLLSDHGEGLAMQGDRITERELFLPSNHFSSIPLFYPGSRYKEPINRSAGHGTDVLGLTQYHTLLGFRAYGAVNKKQVPGIKAGIVSLLSIKPTLLDWLDLKRDTEFAPSLLTIMQNKSSQLSQDKPIFLESDFTPDAILTVHPNIQEVLLEGIKIFKVDPDTLRLSVKNNMYKMIIESKQYANIRNHWILALYPQSDQTYIPILVNLQSGLWTNDLHSSFAQHSPAIKMLNELKSFYGDEMTKKLKI